MSATPGARLVVERVRGLPADPLDVVTALAAHAGQRRLSAFSGRWGAGGTVVTSAPVTVVEQDASAPEDPFDVLGGLHPLGTGRGSAPQGAVGGGWVTVLGHALGRRTGRVRTRPGPVTGPRLPDVVAAFHDHVLRHDGSVWWAEALDRGDGAALGRARELAELVRSAGATPPPTHGAALVRLPDAVAHMAAVERCVTAIRAGEIAQANVCARFELRLADGGPAAVLAWTDLVRELRPDRAALVTGPWGALVGASPELYLALGPGTATSAPIKGTRPAGDGAALRASAKDASENVMIVDLVRNDLSRVCEPGTVEVGTLLSVEPHSGVSHLVSRVSGRLRPGTSTAEVLRATFPPGSVTGTPKQRATEVTDLLEQAARGAHTGAVGLLGPALAELAVTIRSLEVGPDGAAELGVGGGVVADSTPAEEWSEVLTKAAPLLTALGVPAPEPGPSCAGAKGLADPGAGLIDTFLVVHGRVVEPADHLARLRRSFWETTGRAPEDDIDDVLASAARQAGADVHRLRLLLAPDGRVSATTAPWQLPLPAQQQPGLELDVVEGPADGMERHKYADRRWLDRLREAGSDDAGGDTAADDDAVAGPGDTGLLETTRSSLLAVLPPDRSARRTLVTPACDGRVLPGVTRQVLVDLATASGWHVELAPLDAGLLSRAEGLVACNALRGAEWVRRVGGVSWRAPSDGVLELSRALLARWQLPAGDAGGGRGAGLGPGAGQ